MDEVKLRGLLDDVFDQAIVYHGFTDYMRDYEVVFYCTADPRTGIPPAHLGYLFRYCVTAEIETAVASSVWAESLDDRLIEYDTGVDLPGYVWGVKWQVDYPGPSVVSDSERAARWAQAAGSGPPGGRSRGRAAPAPPARPPPLGRRAGRRIRSVVHRAPA
jgi:hypothetical protein